MSFFVKIAIALVLFPTVLGGSLWVLEGNGFFQVSDIQMEWVAVDKKPLHLESQMQKLQKDLENLKGHSLWKLDLSELSQKVSKQNWIKNFHWVRTWPSTLRLQVEPQPSLLVYKNKQGYFFPLVASGEMLESVPAQKVPDAVVLTGEVFEKKLELRQKAYRVIEEIPESGLFSRASISEMSFSNTDGFFMNLMATQWRVKMGEEQIRKKSFRVSQVMEYLHSQKFEARVIDANLSQKVLVRLRKAP